MRPFRRSGLRRALPLAVAVTLIAGALAACTTPLKGHGTASTPSASPTSASASPTSTSTAPTVRLTNCAKLFNLNAAGIPAARLKHLTFDCGKVTVPLDYDDPDGSTIDLQVLRVHDDQQTNRLGSLILNPGGPGGSGLTLPIALAGAISNQVLLSYDLVGFDPRGVGLSSPIQCISNTELDSLSALDPDVRTADGLAAAKTAAQTVADNCNAQYGPNLADYNTLYTAMDLDRIRAAMGDSHLNYLGFSYGTEIGTVYAHLYPQKIGVAVLDGAVDPTLDHIATAASQASGFEDAFNQFAADCLTKPACAPLVDPRAVVMSLIAQADASPLRSPRTTEKRLATGGIVLTAVISALYDQSEWPTLATALINAQKGNPDGLFQLNDEYYERDSAGNYSNLFDAYTAISCNDAPTGPSDAVIKAMAVKWATEYPMFGLSQAASLVSCQAWQADRHLLPPPSAVGSAPILVVGTTHDPATPYSGAQHLATALKTGVLLTYDGQGHTAYLKSTCIDDAVDAYLVDQTVPAAGTVCPGS